MLLSVHVIEGSAPRRQPNINVDDADWRVIARASGTVNSTVRWSRDWSIGPAHELRQLGAGVDAQLGERIVDMVFDCM
jgi:hypothetical protein